MPDTPRYMTPEAMAAFREAQERAGTLPELRNAPTADLSGFFGMLPGGQLSGPILTELQRKYLPLGVTETGNPDFYGPIAAATSYVPGIDPRNRAIRAQRMADDLRFLDEIAIGAEDFTGALSNIGRGAGGLRDYATAALSVLPFDGVGRAIGRRVLGVPVVGEGLQRIGRWLSHFDPIADNADDVIEAAFREGATADEIMQLSQEVGTPAEWDSVVNAVTARDAGARYEPGAAVNRQQARDMSPPPSANIGLVVEPDMSGTGRRELLSPDEARQQLADLGVNIRRDQVRASMTEPTLVAELDRALTPEEAFAVSSNLRQKAIAHVGPEGGALSGPLSAEWGTFNPEYYMPFAETYSNAPLVTDPLSARLVYEAQVARRQLQERALAEAQMLPVEGRSAGLNALNARNAEPYLAQLPSEETLRRRLSGLGINPDTMDADWARSLAVDRLRDTPANPTSALGVHYSRVPDLTQTDPSFYGTGHRGADYGPTRARGGPNRTHFYISRDGSPVVPEPEVERVAPYRYEADLEGMYDLDADPDMLVALARAHQGRNIMTGAGYKPTIPGYMSQGQGLESGSAIPDVERLYQQYGYGGFLADFGSQRAAGMFNPVAVRRAP